MINFVLIISFYQNSLLLLSFLMPIFKTYVEKN